MDDHGLPKEITQASSIEDAAERLGQLLGLAGSAPQAATAHALRDPRFARALVAARNLPELRDSLLDGAVRTETTGGGALAARAGRAVLKWGMEGLRPAEPWVIARRLAACSSCPHRKPAPDTLFYRGAKIVPNAGAQVCTLCGCLINTKAALPGELCPGRDTENPAHSRWGDVWVELARHPRSVW